MNEIHSITLTANDIAGMFAVTIFFQLLMVFAIYVLGKGIAAHKCPRVVSRNITTSSGEPAGRHT
jgi:hypothetical protein